VKRTVAFERRYRKGFKMSDTVTWDERYIPGFCPGLSSLWYDSNPFAVVVQGLSVERTSSPTSRFIILDWMAVRSAIRKLIMSPLAQD
jgi:hypothetical protein